MSCAPVSTAKYSAYEVQQTYPRSVTWSEYWGKHPRVTVTAMLDDHFDELESYQFMWLPREHKYFTTGNYLRANGRDGWARIDLAQLLTNGHRLLVRTGLEVQPNDARFWWLLNELRCVLVVATKDRDVAWRVREFLVDFDAFKKL